MRTDRWGVLAGLACVAQVAAAQSTGRFLTFENDMFFNTDKYYTNGIQLSLRGAAEHKPGWLQTSCLALACGDKDLVTTQQNFGQLMYTPTKITVREPQPWDHPWGGLLYYERAYLLAARDGQSLTNITWQVGVTGPAALAEESQKLFHRALDRPLPQGWDNQIGGSLAAMATVEDRRAVQSLHFDLGSTQVRTAAYLRAAFGNIQTYGAAGAMLTIGKGLPDVSNGPAGILNKFKAEAEDTSCYVSWLRCTAFAGVEARVMVYNVFLDGRLFRDDDVVESRALVGDVVTGFRLDFPHTRTPAHGPWFLQFKATRRSPEFRSTHPVSSQSVGALTIGMDYQ
ncbi:MAG: lipid A deacylase LpxR family protein [Telluria sp.]